MTAPSHSGHSLKILFVTSEIHPLVKTGGLGDVSAALPAALQQAGVDVRVLIPAYPQIMAGAEDKKEIATLPGLPGEDAVRLVSGTLPGSGITLLIVDYPPYYDRSGGPYQDRTGRDWPDNARRFGLLSHVGALLGCHRSPLAWHPDIVHCNDWQGGLVPAYLHYREGKKAATVMALHNLAYQGIFPPATMKKLGLPPASFSIHGVEYYGNLSFLKAGLFYADHITTVSPTYADEIQHEPLGFGMQGLLASRRDRLTGILNGIDVHDWNPQTDRHLARNYGTTTLADKQDNKRALQRRLMLQPSPRAPLLAVVSRITHQKGLDLLLEIAPALLETPAQLALLGSGEAELEQAFASFAARHPGKVSAVIGFDEALSHQLEAGADIFLMPSRFEPCGLNQMYSMRYGTPPVVHATGGLADSVVDASPKNIRNGCATGFVFRRFAPEDFLHTVQRAVAAYHDKKLWHALQRNGMRQDFSWEKSAQAYVELYRSLRERHRQVTATASAPIRADG